jgi:hypothetical protein
MNAAEISVTFEIVPTLDLWYQVQIEVRPVKEVVS